MNCEEAANLISRRIDGELAGDDPAGLAMDAHLAGCADCRAAAEAMELQDAALVRAFAPRRAAARAVAERVAAALAPPLTPPAPARTWGQALVPSAIAAGIVVVLGLVGWQVWRSAPGDGGTAALPVARVTLATGEVFTCPSHSTDAWEPVAPGAPVAEGTRIRTAPSARAELRLADGSQLRLNQATEARLVSGPAVELNQGQVWSAVPRDSRPLRVTVPGNALAAVTMPGGRTDVACTADAPVVTAVSGRAKLIDPGRREVEIAPGESATLPAGAAAATCAAADVLLATSWVNDLLVLKGRDDPELMARVDELLSRIKADPATSPGVFEQLLRSEGHRWSEPLACHVLLERSKADRAKRLTAARLLSDLAPPSTLPDLIALMGDADGQVRLYAARALHRLTGQTFGQTPEQCAAETGPAVEVTRKKWEAWWAENRERYGGRG